MHCQQASSILNFILFSLDFQQGLGKMFIQEENSCGCEEGVEPYVVANSSIDKFP